jgi:hypothetical protein
VRPAPSHLPPARPSGLGLRDAAAVTAWAAALALSSAAHAVTVPELKLQPPPATACLTATDPRLPRPDYPFELLQRKQQGRVLVELSFSSPNRPPAVQVLEQEGGTAFVDEVQAHLRTLRLPCLNSAEGPVALRQEYFFRPDTRKVSYETLATPTTPRQKALQACIKMPESDFSYPTRAQRDGVQGRLFALLKFNAPDQPPEVKLHHMNSASVFARTVTSWAQGYRLPCFEPGSDTPVWLSTVFIFRLDGSGGFGFHAMRLQDFMGLTKGIQTQSLQLDTTPMGCPFDVRLTYLRPGVPNDVGTVGPATPEQAQARAPLIAWLRDAELNLRSEQLASVYADIGHIQVPCLQIDLKP